MSTCPEILITMQSGNTIAPQRQPLDFAKILAAQMADQLMTPTMPRFLLHRQPDFFQICPGLASAP
jgi:hypothetical protein